jgi:hypothetical protein
MMVCVREVFLHVLKQSYWQQIKDGGLPEDSTAALLLLASVDKALEQVGAVYVDKHTNTHTHTQRERERSGNRNRNRSGNRNRNSMHNYNHAPAILNMYCMLHASYHIIHMTSHTITYHHIHYPTHTQVEEGLGDWEFLEPHTTSTSGNNNNTLLTDLN